MSPHGRVAGVPRLPREVERVTAGYEWRPVTEGESGASVFALGRPRAPGLFVKVGEGPEAARVAEEAQCLAWARGRLPTPAVVLATKEAETAWLVTSALPGSPGSASRWTSRPEPVVRALARALRALHALPVADCPFDRSLDRMLEAGAARVEAGLVNERDFQPELLGTSARDVLARLRASRPATEDRVVAHGDACLPNALFDETGAVGFVDVGALGVSDRHRDLALAAESVEWNLGADWVPRLFAEYGLEPDPVRLRYYLMLNELF